MFTVSNNGCCDLKRKKNPIMLCVYRCNPWVNDYLPLYLHLIHLSTYSFFFFFSFDFMLLIFFSSLPRGPGRAGKEWLEVTA